MPQEPVAPQPQPQPQPRFSGPMPVAFGACSSEQTRWVSGPRPHRRDAPEAPVEQARQAGLLGSESTQPGAFASLTGTADVSSGFDDSNIYGGLLGNEAGSAGSGSDSAVGWGTIGTGRYGAIGHGSGTGAGYGVDDGGDGRLHGQYPAVPSLTLGQPVANGPLDKAIIRRYVKRNLMKLQYCYEKQLLAKPGIKGTIVMHFSIAPSGDVASATSKGFDPDVASCVNWVIQSIQFPKPEGNSSVEVSYPISFRPGGSSPAHTAAGELDKEIIRRFIKRNIQKIQYCYEKQLLVTPGIKGTIHTHFFITPSGKVSSATGEGFDPTVASCVAGVIQQIQFPKPKGGGGVAVNYPFVFHEADDSPSKGAGSGSDATTPPAAPTPPHGEDAPEQTTANPLQAASPALADCFRQNPVPYGAVVVEMHYAPAGTVSSANVYGLDGAAARACVLDVVKRLAPAAKFPATQRCSLAFGQMPASALPAIGIAGGAITFGGHALTSDALGSELAARRQAALAPNGTVVSILGPLVVRPDGATPMNVVYDVLDRVRAAQGGFVLAAHRGGDWRLLRDDVALPAVPVPLGAPDAPAGEPDDERVNLSVYIGKDHVWIGLSRVNEFQELAPGADLADALTRALQQQKASAFFADRADIEIGADDGVSYADVVSVIDVATKTGFSDWRLARLQALSARPTL